MFLKSWQAKDFKSIKESYGNAGVEWGMGELRGEGAHVWSYLSFKNFFGNICTRGCAATEYIELQSFRLGC